MSSRPEVTSSSGRWSTARGGRLRHLAPRARRRAHGARFRPDVVYAHFLVPAGLWATLAAGRRSSLTAHGQDVENARSSAVVRRGDATRSCARGGGRRRLRVAARPARRRSCRRRRQDDGDRLRRRRRALRPARSAAARAEVGLAAGRHGVPLCRRARASARTCSASRGRSSAAARASWRSSATGRCGRHSRADRASGSSAPVAARRGAELDGRGATSSASRASRSRSGWRRSRAWRRPSVVATRVGGPPEFVPPGAGVLVDPEDETALAAALAAAAALPRPNAAARQAALEHDVRRQAERVEELLARAARDRRA